MFVNKEEHSLRIRENVAIMKLNIPWMTFVCLFLCHVTTVSAWISTTTRTPSALTTALLVSPFQQENKKPVLKSLQIRAVDPSAVPAVGDNVVAMSDLTELGLWEYQSYALQAITDCPAATPSSDAVIDIEAARSTNQGNAVERLDDPQTPGYTRYVTLSGRSVGSVTLRLAGIYNHGLSSLWILEIFL